MNESPDQLRSIDSLYRRVAAALVPILLLCYIVAMIDRLNVGYAKLQFMSDLNFDEAVFGMAAGILYIGYILFEIPSNLMLERIGLRLTLLRIMSLWGLTTMALAFAATRWEFYTARFFIGAAEAGFFPGVLYYLTLWFPSRWRARITSLFAVGVPVSGVIAAPVSGWVMTNTAGVAGFKGWQWLFLLEGVPAVALAVIVYLVMPDRPSKARFLSDGEKAWIARDLAQDSHADTASGSFAEALRTPRTYVLALVYFAFYSAQSILLLWVPTLLRNSGVTSLAEIGWRASLIFIAGALGMTLTSWSSDRSQERRWHLIACGAVTSSAYFMLPAASRNPDTMTLCLAFASIAVFSFLALFWTVPTAILGKNARAGGIALVSSIGASGSAVSPAFIGWMQVLTGSFFGAIDVLAAVFLFSMLGVYICAPARSAARPAAAPGETLRVPADGAPGLPRVKESS